MKWLDPRAVAKLGQGGLEEASALALPDERGGRQRRSCCLHLQTGTLAASGFSIGNLSRPGRPARRSVEGYRVRRTS
jgi:hypothetical protein